LTIYISYLKNLKSDFFAYNSDEGSTNVL
jgi:hypothetical protein